MSQKKIKQEKRELRNMEGKQKNVGKWIASVIAIILIGTGAYLMMGEDPQISIIKKTATNTNTSTTTMDTTQNQKSQESNEKPAMKSHEFVVIETSKGTMKVKLYPEDAPKTVANFVALADKKFYDGLKFHRVEPGFVIQGGDPQGTGMGGSDATIPLEIRCADADGTMTEGKLATCEPVLKHLDGAIAMARSSDPNSASSQFYITLGEQSFLDKNYAVFGYVVEGLDVASKIQVGDIMKKIYLQK